MTFDAEAVKHQSEPRWLVEFTDGASTYRFSEQPINLTGSMYVEGRVTAISQISSVLNTTVDGTGPSITVADPDGTVEDYGIAVGWKVTIKAGFAALAYASWDTIGTFRVAKRPRRSGRKLTFECQSNLLFTMGRLQNMPAIEEGDAYLFGTLNTEPGRIGELLPVRFGRHSKPGGAFPLLYLGFDASSETLVYLASAADKTENPTMSVEAIYLDGILLDKWGDYTTGKNTSGNYCLLTVSVGIDTAARLGIIDGKIYRDYKRAQIFDQLNFRGRRRNRWESMKGGDTDEISFGARPIKTLSADIDGPFAAPTDLLDYLWTRHGDGTANRDSSSYSDVATRMSRFGIDCSGTITGADSLLEVANAICAEIGIEQYQTPAGLHALVWPYSVTASESKNAFANNGAFSDFEDVIGEPVWTEAAGRFAPVNRIDLETSIGDESLEDSSAASTYGASSIRWQPRILGSVVAARALAWHKIQTRKQPKHIFAAKTALSGLVHDIASMMRVTARGGPALGGWADNPARLLRRNFEPMASMCDVALIDRASIEDTDNAYTVPLNDYDPYGGGFSCSFTSGSDQVTTSSSNATTIRVGDYLQYFASGSSNAYTGRVTKVILGSPNTIYLNRQADFTATVNAWILRSSLPSTACHIAGRTSDGLRVPANPDLAAPPVGNTIAGWPLHEYDGQQPQDEAAVRTFSKVGTLGVDLTGQHGEAVSFDGSSYWYQSTADADLNISGAFTISAWINRTAYAGYTVLCACGGGSTGLSADNTQYAIFINSSGRVYCWQQHGAGIAVNAYSNDGLVTDGTWQFLAITRSSGGVVGFYLGDQDTEPTLDKSMTIAMPDGGANCGFGIGVWPVRFSYQWRGSINALQIIDTDMAAADIVEHYYAVQRATASKVA